MQESFDVVTVLVIADPASGETIAATLQRGAYACVSAQTPQDALDLMHVTRPHAIVLASADRAPGFLESALALDPALALVVLGPGEPAPPPGVSLLPRDCSALDLLRAVGAQLRRRIERLTEAAWRQTIEEAIAERSTALEQKLQQFTAASLEVLVTALEARDPFMTGHSIRVAQLSASLAHTMGYPDAEVEDIRLAGRLHDIGMLTISEQVVNREGPLTEEELDQVRHHPVAGHQLLQPYAHLSQVARYIRGHHERWDGTGYPDGLAGEEIPWGARVIAVAETYDALVTSRAYRRDVQTPGEACRRLQDLGGSALDPAAVDALTAVVMERRSLEFLLEHTPVRYPPPQPRTPAGQDGVSTSDGGSRGR